jgi:hypothetical protein
MESTQGSIVLRNDDRTQAVSSACATDCQVRLRLKRQDREYSIDDAWVASTDTRIHHTFASSSRTRTHAGLLDQGRFFRGVRNIRLLSIVVYAHVGTDTFELPDAIGYARSQRRFVDAEYRHSTYGKLGFDDNRSVEVEVDISTFFAQRVADGNARCVTYMYDVTMAAFEAATVGLGLQVDDFDAIFYHVPVDVARSVHDCRNIAGMCGWPGKNGSARTRVSARRSWRSTPCAGSTRASCGFVGVCCLGASKVL